MGGTPCNCRGWSKIGLNRCSGSSGQRPTHSPHGESTDSYFISQSKTFEKTAPEAQQLFDSHDYAIRMAPKTFVPETLFIDWFETVFLVRINELRQKFAYEGPVILFVDGNSMHLTPRVIAFCETNRVICIRLVVHSSHISHPLGLHFFRDFQDSASKGEADERNERRDTENLQSSPFFL
jgi:hypothetical protein